MRQTLAIKGMVCNRCISVLKAGLEELGLVVHDIGLGTVEVTGLAGMEDSEQLDEVLENLNFQLLIDRNKKIVNEIKRIVDSIFANLIYTDKKDRFSAVLAEKLNLNYDSLSGIFSKTEGTTLENYIIHKRIDKIKEFLVYTDYSLIQVAFFMGYSSVFHLSRQFKQVTGQNPSAYRKIRLGKLQTISE